MSQAYQIEGKIIIMDDTQTFGSGFTKREFVIETSDDKYPQKIKLEAVKAGCDKLDAYKVGDGIKVDFNIRGNEYNGKYYVQLSAWKFERIGAPVGVTSPEYGRHEQRSGSQNGARPPANVQDDDGDEIPF
jgi:single-strand DNA-binding protein